MKIDTFTNAYLNLINEDAAYNIIGLANFKFPRYKFKNVSVGDELVYVYTSDTGRSGAWGISYWYVTSKKVKVVEVNGNNFTLDNGITVIDNTSGKMTTEKYTENVLDATGTDMYDLHTELPETTRTYTESKGSGVYPASFLLKYYTNSEQIRTPIGGGGNYRGLSFDELKEMALKEQSVQKELKKSIGTKLEPTEKDIERIKDVLYKDDYEFYFTLTDREEWTSNHPCITRFAKYGYRFEYSDSVVPDNKDIKELTKIFVNLYSHVLWDDKPFTKPIEKMVKLIKDYDKCIRRMKAVDIVAEELKQKIPQLSKDYKTVSIEDCPIIEELRYRCVKKYEKHPTIAKRITAKFNELPIYVDNSAAGYFDRIVKKIKEIFEEKAEELKKYRDNLQK